MKKILNLSLWLLFACALAACGGGGGSADSSGGPNLDPDGDGFNNAVDIDDDNDGLIEITTLEELDWMRNSLTGEYLEDHEGNRMMDGCLDIVCIGYELVADLDFDTNGDGMMDENDTYYDYHDDDTNRGWSPIGDLSASFQADFEGNDHRISNLFVDRPDEGVIGLFGDVDGQAAPIAIRNIVLDGELIVMGEDGVGSLVGFATNNITISNISAIGSVMGDRDVGGLVGYAYIVTISDSSASGSVTGTERTGGLMGVAENVIITDSSAGGSVTGIDRTGGLVGSALDNAMITNSSASGSVTGSGSYAGGLVGFVRTNVTVSNSSAGGAVTGLFSTGGLLGYAQTTVSISDSSASGNVTGNEDYVGGLIGYARDEVNVSNSSASGNVVGLANTGGLLGIATNLSTIEDSYATGTVEGTILTGGLIGGVNFDRDSGQEDGLVTIDKVFATGAVTTADDSYVGGLVGISYDMDLTNSFATGAVSGGDRYVGGLVGDANDGSSIGRSFSANTIDGATEVGGFVGWSDGATYVNNYFASDSNTPALQGVGAFVSAADQLTSGGLTDVTGETLPDLQSVTSAGENAVFINWGDEWDFGSDTQLPGLIIDGVIYRDGDADGVLD